MPARIDRYQILGELGRGGMGIVYRGLDPELDREVAIKVIAVEGGEATMSELEARFRREARAAAKVTHPGVVTIYDVGREGAVLGLVMGLVHRDVKPGNILFSENRQVKVTDFGVARAMGQSSELTRTGIVVGSPAYMAPEQVLAAPVDGRADLFALGVILYEMLLRTKPF